MKKLIFLLSIIGIVFLQSCSLTDESVLAEEYQNEVHAFDFLKPSISKLAFNQSSIIGRVSAGLMQYLTDEGCGAFQSFSRYYLGDNLINNTWNEGFYGGSLSSAYEMKTLAIAENEQDLLAISLILMAHEYSVLTTVLGDIPLSESLLGSNNTTPRYDTQEAVFKSVVDMLDEAIQLIGSNTNNSKLASADPIYQGQMQNWKKFAFGLKARCFLNQRNKKGGLDNEILALLEQSFASKDEQATFEYGIDMLNPLYEFNEQRPATYRAGDHFVEQLLINQDPRRDKYIVSDANGTWDIFNGPRLRWTNPSSSVPILSYSEILFMRTEALFHTGANIVEITNALSLAIQSSLEENNIALDENSLPFVELKSDLTGLNDEEILERIISQAYFSYFGYNHLQSWNNYRRTGYPALIGTSSFPNEFNPSNIIPRRLLYPYSEHDYNSSNVEAAISRQGGDLLDNDIWVYQ